MSTFKKYKKTKPLEYEESTKGILNGECHFFPIHEYHQVLCSLWWEMGYWIDERKKTGKMGWGYCDEEMDEEKRGRIFRKFIIQEMPGVYAPLFREHNDLMLFGGFSQEKDFDFDETELVFEVWDVFDFQKFEYLNYKKYSEILDKYKINYQRAIKSMNDPSYEDVLQASPGGVIVKNYSFQQAWATVQSINKYYYQDGFFLDYGRHNPGYFNSDK